MLNLQGAPNFRDFGGQTRGDGRVVRPGQLFRSQSLHALTDSDLDVLRELDIRLICDLRNPRERALRPSRWPGGIEPQRLNVDVPSTFLTDSGHLREDLRGHGGIEAARQLMLASYRQFPMTFAGTLADLFRRLLSGNPAAGAPSASGCPLLVHCSAGKDRTGFVSATILAALQISRDAIMDDYLLTRVCIDPHVLVDATAHSLEALLGYVPPEAVLAVIAGVSPEFLDAAFASIGDHYGSVSQYLESACGLDAAGCARLCRRLCDE